jgi:hypothetical protein
MVASWGDRNNHRFFIGNFGLSYGRMISRYPKNWIKRVWQSFEYGRDMDKKRLEEFLSLMKESMVKRKDYSWEDSRGSWIENALIEHNRHPFRAILARNNDKNLPQIIRDFDIGSVQATNWESCHGITIKRNAAEMLFAVEMMLLCCRWVKFIDPYFAHGKKSHQSSLKAFLKVLKSERPVGKIESIEIHTRGNISSGDFLHDCYGKIIPVGLSITVCQ